MASLITRLAFLTTEAAAARMRVTKLVNPAAICRVAHACPSLERAGFLNDPGADATRSQDTCRDASARPGSPVRNGRARSAL